MKHRLLLALSAPLLAAGCQAPPQTAATGPACEPLPSKAFQIVGTAAGDLAVEKAERIYQRSLRK